jgi:predicted AlkP superfamily phosphohydrolase/phosphomutase
MLQEKHPDYQLDIPTIVYTPETAREFLDALTGHAGELTDITSSLVAQETPDHLFAVFTATDRVQHCMMDDLRALTGKEGQPELGEALQAFYQALDEQIGRLLALASPEANVIVLSDHGFTRARRVLHLNDWLEREGFLSTFGARHVGNRIARGLVMLTDAVRRWRGAGVRTYSTQRMLGKPINWKGTRAFCNSFNGIFLNRAGRFEKGIVSPAEATALREGLRGRLLDLRDPGSGQKLVEAVLDREEVYSGPYVDLLPDLLIVFHDDEHISTRYFNLEGTPPDHLFSLPTERTNGQHHRHGVFVGSGPVFRKRFEGETIHLQDIAPLLLYLNRVPIPEDMDGAVPLEFLTAEAQAMGAEVQAASEDASGRDHLSEEEEAIIHQRLVDLGYLE